MENREKIIRPGTFSINVPADTRRLEFDYKNEVIVTNKVSVDFVFIGDSITHFWELYACFETSNVLINRGIGRDNSQYVQKRFEADVIQLKPRYAVLNIGVNDVLTMEDNPWQRLNGKPGEDVEEEITNNILSIINLCKDKDQKLILCSILPINIVSMQKSKKMNEIILCVINKLKKMALENGIIYTDYHSCFVTDDGVTLIEGVSEDNVHPHVKGYNMMADILRDTLKKYNIKI